MRIEIAVTAADIRTGLPMDCRHCPISIALKRTLKQLFNEPVNVQVTASRIVFNIGHDLFHRSTTYDVRNFVLDFDGLLASRKTCKPFTFKLNIPVHY